MGVLPQTKLNIFFCYTQNFKKRKKKEEKWPDLQ